ncbi:hypothetical protein ACFFRR_011493 [Megaselia abdita]
MSKVFKILKFINNGEEQEFMVASSWSNDQVVEVFLLNEKNQFRTSIKSQDFKEFSDELGLEESDLRSKVFEAFTNPTDANTFEIVDDNFLLSTKSGRNSKILISTDLKQTKDLHQIFLLGSMTELQKTQDQLKASNEQLSTLTEQFETLENEMLHLIDAKERVEIEACKKFTRLLNSKKQKIKELRKELYPDEEGEFDESDDEPLKRRESVSSDSDSEYEVPKPDVKPPKRKSLKLVESVSDDSDNDFTALTQVMDILPKRVKLDDAILLSSQRNESPQPGTSNENPPTSQTSQDLLEML